MSKNKNQNKNQTSYEEQNRQLVDALYEQKLVKPTCSDCDDYFGAMVPSWQNADSSRKLSSESFTNAKGK